MKIGSNVIAHKWFEEIISEIDDLRSTGYMAANTEVQMLRGPARVGKSVLLRRYADTHRPRQTEDGWIRPVVLIEAPGRGKTKPFAEALLTQLDDPTPSRGTETTMMERAKHHLMEQKTELVIIDEVQDAMRGDLYDAADFFKHILNWEICPLLLAGLPHAIDFFKENEQLRWRSRENIDMKPFDWWDREQKIAFRGIIKTFEGMLPEEITSISLSEEPIAARLNYATEGAIGRLTRLLKYAERMAKKQPEREITMKVLAAAYEKFEEQEPEDLRRRNPFTLKELPERWSPLTDGGSAVAKNKLAKAMAARTGAE